MKRYFITGTDTACGKTYVTCALVDYFKQRQKRVLGIKPVASGAIEQDGQLVNDDLLNLQRHNGDVTQEICRWLLKPPISPHLAAEQSGQHISAKMVSDFCFSESFLGFEYLLIEGAGGLMAPLNSNDSWIDFLSMSQIPIILVVGMRLGCLNHALLTELALNAYRLNCVGWIANCIDKDMLELSANIRTLSSKIKSPLLSMIPYGGKLDETFNLKRLG